MPRTKLTLVPEDEQQSELQGRIENALVPLVEERDRLEAERSETAARAAALAASVRRLDAVIRAAEPKTPKPAQKTVTRGMTEKTKRHLEMVKDALVKSGQQMNPIDLMEATKLTRDQVHKSLGILHSQGAINKVGVVPNPRNGGRGTVTLYAAWPTTDG
jgi:hypothetical protein